MEGFFPAKRHGCAGFLRPTRRLESLRSYPDEAGANLQNHQVDFEEASPIFDDLQFITFLDEEHSTDEERVITIGLSNKNRLLMVAHTERKDVIRIISARKATKPEEKFYQEAG